MKAYSITRAVASRKPTRKLSMRLPLTARENDVRKKGRLSGFVVSALIGMCLAGCSGNPLAGGDGPSLGRIKKTTKDDGRSALLLNVDTALARRLEAKIASNSFGSAFGQGQPYGSVIGPGEILQISLFEAPPAVLLGSSIDTNTTAAGQRATVLPDIQVDAQGRISIPFAGSVNVLGKTPEEVAGQIVARLKGRAHQPQAVVSLRGAASTVTVVGQVRNSMRVPLTARGERVLDAIAAAGGTTEPVDKVSLQITRGTRNVEMPLDRMIASPNDNIFLRAGDVLTVSFQPRSFTVLGATGRNEEIKFEARGISLAQALGRIGGLRDERANPSGLFVFRLEDAATIADIMPDADLAKLTDADGKVPVIYRADLRDPATFFAAQHFLIHDSDLIYVTNAPIADLQKFVNIIGAAIYPVVTVEAAGF